MTSSYPINSDQVILNIFVAPFHKSHTITHKSSLLVCALHIIVQSCVQHQPHTARSIPSAAQPPKSASSSTAKSPRIKVHKVCAVSGSGSQARGPLAIARLLQQHHLLVDILRHIATSAPARTTAAVAAAVKVANNTSHQSVVSSGVASVVKQQRQAAYQRAAMLSSLEALAGKISPGSGKNSPSQQLFNNNNNGLENNNNNCATSNNNNASTKVAVFNANIHPYQKLQDINSNRDQ